MEVWYAVTTILNSLYPKISKIDFVNILARLLLLAILYDSIIPCAWLCSEGLPGSFLIPTVDGTNCVCPQDQSRTGVVLTGTHLLTRT